MERPQNMITYNNIDLKLGIKSSLPNPKTAIATLLLIWQAAGKPAVLEYAESDDDKLVIKKELKEALKNYLDETLNDNNITDEQLFNAIQGSALYTSQLEALKVAFELIWQLAVVRFTADNLANSAERTGTKRYPKRLHISINADIIALLFENTEQDFQKVLSNWIGLSVNEINRDVEMKLKWILTAMSEKAIFKLTDGDKAIVFNQQSIYDKLLEGCESLDIKGDDEAKGSLRILKNIVKNKLNPFIETNHDNNVILNEQNKGKIKDYRDKISTFLELNTVKYPNAVDESQDNLNAKEKVWNYIIFGAPGTGKSHKLEEEKDKLIGDSGYYERVTFHPDYTYANFVGCYKPVPKNDKDKEGNVSITYEYVPGPFMRTLKSALNDSSRTHLLLIEEINRANVAAVFGDVFQLLDRNVDGTSKYEIHTTEDMRTYLKGEPDTIIIPSNMYIWATMNSADQGVYPMDTAFKRRWDFEYIGIDDEQKAIEDFDFTIDEIHKINWNKLRKAINTVMQNEGINEDKLMGPFFIASEVLKEEKNKEFLNAFCDKVLMYLYEDAARTRRDKIFAYDTNSNNKKIVPPYSKLRKDFRSKGIEIFVQEIRDLVNACAIEESSSTEGSATAGTSHG